MTRSRLIGVVMMLIAAMVAIAVPAGPAGAATGALGKQLTTPWNLNSGLCMGVEGGHTNNGHRVIQWGCDGTDNQKWWIDFSGDYSEVVNRRASDSRKVACLGVSGGSTADGAQLVVWECDGSDNQQWRTEGSPACGGHILVNKGSGRLISVEGASGSQGAPIILWHWGGTPDQTWCH
jgi:ricin-type beta-trefoil lectin protein